MRFFRDVKKYYKYLIYSTKSQLKSEVSNAYLDWVWWILEPLCNMIVYTIVFGVVLHASEEYFPAFIFIGITMWGFFSKCARESVTLLKSNKQIVSKTYVPKHILLLRNMCVNGFKMLISFGVIVIMLIALRVKINICVLYMVPALILLLIFTYGLCCFFVHYGVYVEDLAYIVGIVLNMLMYFTGIFYNIEKRVPSPFGQILCFGNPVALAINSVRDGLLYREGGKEIPLLIWLVLSVLLAMAGTRLIYKNENSYAKVL